MKKFDGNVRQVTTCHRLPQRRPQRPGTHGPTPGRNNANNAKATVRDAGRSSKWAADGTQKPRLRSTDTEREHGPRGCARPPAAPTPPRAGASSQTNLNKPKPERGRGVTPAAGVGSGALAGSRRRGRSQKHVARQRPAGIRTERSRK